MMPIRAAQSMVIDELVAEEGFDREQLMSGFCTG